jgi:hypothetical protein
MDASNGLWCREGLNGERASVRERKGEVGCKIEEKEEIGTAKGGNRFGWLTGLSHDAVVLVGWLTELPL